MLRCSWGERQYFLLPKCDLLFLGIFQPSIFCLNKINVWSITGQSPSGWLKRIVLHGEEYLAVLLSKSSYRICSQNCDTTPYGYRTTPNWTGGKMVRKQLIFKEKNSQILNDIISDVCLEIMTLITTEILATAAAFREPGLWEHRPQVNMEHVPRPVCLQVMWALLVLQKGKSPLDLL